MPEPLFFQLLYRVGILFPGIILFLFFLHRMMFRLLTGEIPAHLQIAVIIFGR